MLGVAAETRCLDAQGVPDAILGAVVSGWRQHPTTRPLPRLDAPPAHLADRTIWNARDVDTRRPVTPPIIVSQALVEPATASCVRRSVNKHARRILKESGLEF